MEKGGVKVLKKNCTQLIVQHIFGLGSKKIPVVPKHVFQLALDV
jgi:hypothetical protein